MTQQDKHSIDYYGLSSVGGSCLPKKSWYKRNDEEKKYLENLRKDDDAWYDHLQREKEYQQQLHNNLY
jgi:hypothetical protein